MAMKRLFHNSFAWLALLMLVAISCVEPISNDEEHGAKNMMPVRFSVRTSDDIPLTKSTTGLITGDFGQTVTVTTLYMYCFDENGRFLGRFQASPVNAVPGSEVGGRTWDGTFNGEIPPATARIHFVANADIPVGNDKIGLTEEQVFHGQTEEFWNLTNALRDQVGYWGYLKCTGTETMTPSEQMAYIFRQGTTIIYLLRDRACIEPGTFDAVSNPDYQPASVMWTIYNGLSNGYVAPYDAEHSSFEGYYTRTYDTSNGETLSPNSVVTPHANQDARDVTDYNDLIPFSGTNYLYAFEDNNLRVGEDVSHAIRLIIRVLVKGTNQELFFPILLADEDVIGMKILRGRRYKVDLGYMPIGLGYDTFEDAAAAHTFVNGQMVSIKVVVPEVSDGTYRLKITYKLGEEENISTAALFDDLPQEHNTVRIPFRFERVDGQALSTSDQYSFAAEWTDEDQTVANEGDITFETSVVNGCVEGYMVLDLKKVGDHLKSGTIRLRETEHKLERNISVYSITKFVLPSYTLTAKSGGGYRLSITLPTGDDEYPAGLYPLRVKLATKSLRPSAAYNGTTQINDLVFGVEVKSTGTEVPGIVNQTNTNQWNYQNPQWNFWYIFTIDTKSSNPVYNIDFDDIRTSYAQANRPTNVGLYLRIEFFGDAKAITGTN